MCILSLADCASQDKMQLPRQAKVIAQDGLYLREDCSINNRQILLIPQFETVTITLENYSDRIGGISDHWYVARYKSREGCLFGGFLNKNYEYVSRDASVKIYDTIQAYEEKKYDEAVLFADQALQYSRKSGEAFLWRGHANWKLKNYESCVLDYSNALRFITTSIVFNNRALCKIHLNDLSGAKKDLDTAMKLSDSPDYKLFSNTCYVLGLLSDSKALEFCNKAIELAPNYPNTYYHRSDIRRKLGFKEDAKLDLETYSRLLKQ